MDLRLVPERERERENRIALLFSQLDRLVLLVDHERVFLIGGSYHESNYNSEKYTRSIIIGKNNLMSLKKVSSSDFKIS